MTNKYGSYGALLDDKRLKTWISAVSKSGWEMPEGPHKGTYNATYLTSWNLYLKYHEEANGSPTTPTKLLGAVIEDRKKEIEDRGTIEEDITKFAEWTKTQGYSDGSIGRYVTALRSFYKYYGYPLLVHKLKLSKEVRRGAPKVENKKIEYRPEQVKQLLDICKSLRDKAIILTMFQSGMDVSTVATLNYSHVQEIEGGATPIMINVIRKKGGINYRTFIGHDATTAIRLYLDERRQRGETITAKTALFVSEGTHINKRDRIKTKNIQDNLRKYTLKAKLISKERMDMADFSPARPHALRTGFSTILKLKGVNQDIVDGFLGHSDKYNNAYTGAADEELREIYQGIEKALSVFGVSTGIDEVEARLNQKLERKDYVINGLEEKINELATQQSVIMKVLEKLEV